MSYYHGSGDYGYRGGGYNRFYGEDKINPADVPPSRHAIFVRGLPGSYSPEDVRDYFREKYGPCSVDFSKYTIDRNILFVAIRFDSRKDADACMNACEGRDLMGHRCDINWYRDIRKYASYLASRRNGRGQKSGRYSLMNRVDHRNRRSQTPRSSVSKSRSRSRSRSVSSASSPSPSRSRSRSLISKYDSEEERQKPSKYCIGRRQSRKSPVATRRGEATSDDEVDKKDRKKKHKKSKKSKKNKRERSPSRSDSHSVSPPPTKKNKDSREKEKDTTEIKEKDAKELKDKDMIAETVSTVLGTPKAPLQPHDATIMQTSFRFNLESDYPPKKLIRSINVLDDQSDDSDLDVVDDTEESLNLKASGRTAESFFKSAIKQEVVDPDDETAENKNTSKISQSQETTTCSIVTPRHAKFPLAMEITKDLRYYTNAIFSTVKAKAQNDSLSLSLLSRGNTLSLSEREAVLTNMTKIERGQFQIKYNALYKQYQNDCRTYAHVVNKLLEKNGEIELAIKQSLMEVATDLESSMMKKLDELLEQFQS